MAKNMLLNKFAVARTGINYTRSVFRHHGQHITNIKTGNITPMEIIDVLPGSSFSLKFGAMLRSATLVAPVLSDIYCDIACFWVPNRLVMNDFAQFLGENNTRAWTLKQDVDYPTITADRINTAIYNPGAYPISRAYYADNFLGDHIGWPFGYNGATLLNSALHINVLPNRGESLIYNEWWRDENIIDPILFSKESGVNLALDLSLYANCGGALRKAARISDLFNKLVPAPQRAGAVPISLGSYAPVYPMDSNIGGIDSLHGNGLFLRMDTYNGLGGNDAYLGVDGTNKRVFSNYSDPGDYPGRGAITKTNLWADLSTAAFNVNSLRYSIALQQFYEVSARTGMREVEFYAGQWSVTSSDSRFARSELLCQKRYRVNVQQVVAQADSDNTSASSNLGDTGAFSATAFGGDLFTKTFTEYGFIHIQAVIRHSNVFSTGWQPYNLKYKFFDYPLPVFDNIGEQGLSKLILQNNVVGSVDGGVSTFLGYMPAWQDWRSEKRTVAGILAPGEPLDYWTLGTAYSSVSLSQDFIEQSFEEFDRALAFPLINNVGTVDADGVPYDSDRYQWIISFESFGTKALILSKDSIPAGLGRI